MHRESANDVGRANRYKQTLCREAAHAPSRQAVAWPHDRTNRRRSSSLEIQWVGYDETGDAYDELIARYSTDCDPWGVENLVHDARN